MKKLKGPHQLARPGIPKGRTLEIPTAIMFRQALESAYPEVAGANSKPVSEKIDHPVDIGCTYLSTAGPWC
jgi:hypothetical protein